MRWLILLGLGGLVAYAFSSGGGSASGPLPSGGDPSGPSRRTLRWGMQGADVATVQAVLNISPATGIFDAVLLGAVQQFQKARGLTVDGVVGPQTWAALMDP